MVARLVPAKTSNSPDAASRRYTTTGAPAAPAECSAVARLSGLARLSAGRAAAATPLAAPAPTAAAIPTPAADNRAAAGHSAGAPLVVYLRDAASGEFDVFAGTSRTSIVDPDLAARLAHAVR